MATITASLRLQPISKDLPLSISSLSSSSFTPPSSRPIYLKFHTSQRENLIPLFPWSNLLESKTCSAGGQPPAHPLRRELPKI
ncbi:unnamed protein product [Brassica oleracea var. botrytis]